MRRAGATRRCDAPVRRAGQLTQITTPNRRSSRSFFDVDALQCKCYALPNPLTAGRAEHPLRPLQSCLPKFALTRVFDGPSKDGCCSRETIRDTSTGAFLACVDLRQTRHPRAPVPDPCDVNSTSGEHSLLRRNGEQRHAVRRIGNDHSPAEGQATSR